jgi:hypothetical protein
MFAKLLLAQLAICIGAHGLNASFMHPPAAVAYMQALAAGIADPAAVAWAKVSARGTRPGAYVHWDVPQGTSTHAQIEHTWRSLPEGGTNDGNFVFMSLMLNMEAGQGGYMGSQMHGGYNQPTESGLFIFSIWDYSQSALTKPYGNNCKHQCTSEGCFTQCRVDTPIEKDVKYWQDVKMVNDDGNYKWWEWYINGAAHGQIGAPNSNGYRGYGNIVLGGNQGFMEYPADTPYGDCNAAYCNVEWRGPWYNDDRSVMPTQAHPQYTQACQTQCVLGYDSVDGWGSNGNPIITMQGGKGTQCNTETGQNLWNGQSSTSTITYLQDQLKCLDLPAGDTTNGNKLELWDCNGADSQQWAFVPGSWTVKYKANPAKCIDVPGGDLGNGNVLQIWDCTGHGNQKWGYDSNTHTIYLASTMNAAKCLDLTGGFTKSGTAIELWDCNGSVNQQWGVGSQMQPDAYSHQQTRTVIV